MSKIQPKGKKVTGTKKKDKINWVSSKAWKKALTVNAGKGNDIINFKKSKYKNTLNGQDGNDVIYGGKNADKIYGGKGNDKLFGYNGNDIIKAGAGNDTIDGGSGNDKIYGESGVNVLKGGKGSDKIYGGSGNDIIYGGADNDIIKAGAGNNTIYIGSNEGTDTILNGGGTDTIVFSNAPDLRNLTFEYYGNDLKISIAGSTALLKDYKNGGHSVKYIKAGDKTLQLPQNVIITNQEDENLWESTDNLFIIGMGENSTIYSGNGNDTVFASQNTITSVNTGSGDDVIVGSDYPFTEGGHLYHAGEGNDTVYVGKAGANVIVQQGNDVIYTAPVNDTNIVSNFVFNEIDGHNTIYWRGNTNNKMFFNSYYNNIKLFKNTKTNDLMISVGNDNFVTIKDYFKSGNEAMATSFSIGSSSEIVSLGDFVEARGLADYIVGTDGDDSIQLEAGRYIVNAGFGNDTIKGFQSYNSTGYGGESDITIYGGDGNDAILAGIGNDYIDGGDGNDTITGRCRNNTLIGGAGDDSIAGGSDADTIYGGDGDDSITTGSGNVNDYVDGGAGNDTINAQQDGYNTLLGGDGNDSIFGCNGSETIDGGEGDDYIDGAGGTDSITGGSGNDTIYGNGTIIGGEGNDQLYGLNGDDFLYAVSGDNTLKGGIGYNKFYSGTGSDIFEFANYSGRNTIYGATSSDKIVFSENYFKHEINKEGNDLVVKYWDDGNYPSNYTEIRLDDYFTSADKLDTITYKDDEDVEHTVKISESVINVSGSSALAGSLYRDSITGTDAADDITAGQTPNDEQYDTIIAGKGDDVIHIEENGKAYIKIQYNEGDDVIYGAASAKSIRFDIAGSSTIKYGYQSGDDFIIIRQYTVDSVLHTNTTTLKNYTLADDTEGIVKIYVQNNGYQPLTSIDLGDGYVPGMEIVPLSGTTSSYDFSGDDNSRFIIGNSNSSKIITGSGDDYINTGIGIGKTVTTSGGNNKIIANGDSDTVTSGAGNDTIYSTGTSNINAGGGNNVITTSDNSDIITTGDGADTISAGDGTNIINAGNGNNSITGGNGSDSIYAGTGNDIIVAGDGQNYVSVTGGNNNITGGSGVDIITTGSGNDIINAGDGNNQITILGGDNTVNTGLGDDSINISGTGENHITAGDGTNSINMQTTGGSSTIDGGADKDYVTLTGGVNEFNAGTGQERVTINGGENDLNMAGAAASSYVVANGGTNNITASENSFGVTLNNGTNTVTFSGENVSGGSANITGGTNTINWDGKSLHATIEGGNNTISTTGGVDNIVISNGTNEISTGSGDDSIYASSVEGGNTSQNTIYGGTGNDRINASYGSSVIYCGSMPNQGDEYDYTDDTINYVTLGGGSNTVYGGSQGDSIKSSSQGNGTIYGGSGNDTIDMGTLLNTRIESSNGADKITSAKNQSYIDAGEGDDTINIVGLASTVIGGVGNDSITVNTISSEGDQTVDITAGSGNNQIKLINLAAETIHFKNDGSNDVISETHYAGSSKEDTLVFDNSHLDELFAAIESVGTAKHLVITYNNGSDTVKILNFQNLDNDIITNISNITTLDGTISLTEFLNSRSIVDLVSDDGESGVGYTGTYFSESITGTPYNDTINGNYGNDTIIGGAGNDSITDWLGYNTIKGGLGNDTISLYANDGTNGNTLEFSANDGFDYVEMNGNDHFDTASTLKFNGINNDNINLSFDKYNNNYGLFINYGTNPNDKVFLNNFTNRDSENIKIATLSQNTTLVDLMAQKHVIGNFVSLQTVEGSTNADYIYTGNQYGTTTIIGGKGNDVITSLADTETIHYVFNIDGSGYGDGNDIIYGGTDTSHHSTIDFTGVGTGVDDGEAQLNFIDSLQCYYENNDLIITYGVGNSIIRIKNYKTGSNIDKFRFVYGENTADYSFNSSLYITNYMTTHNFEDTIGQNDFVIGTDGDDTINAGNGNNKINPDDGADTIIISGSGEDKLYMGAGDTADILWFKDAQDRNDLTVSRQGNDFRINVVSTGKTVLLKDYFLSAGPEEPTQYMNIVTGEDGNSDSFKLSDIYTKNNVNNREVKLSYVEGTVFNDSIYVSDVTAEEIYAGDGNDRIIMENNSLTDTKADIIYLGAGNDTIDYYNADNDGIEIYGDAGRDSITLYSGKVYGGAGSDVITVNPNSTKNVTIYGGAPSSLNESALDKDTLTGGRGNDLITGSKGSDDIYGKEGNDYIMGQSGNDKIEGGDGIDTIYGGIGNDLIYSHSAARIDRQDGIKSELYGGIGQDTIYANAAYNIISGDGGDDSIIAHDNTINEYHFKKGNGADVVKSSKYWNGGQGSYKDVIIFDDMDFTTDGIQANLDIESGTLTISYGDAGNLTNTITIDNYVSVTGTSVSYVSSIDKLIDKNGKTIRLSTLCKTPDNFVSTGDNGTVFSDNIVPSDYNWMYSNGGNDTITGITGQNNALYAAAYYSYALDRKDWSVEGNCYLDGQSGANILVGGMGNDTIKGGYDLNTDNIYGGFGANTYIISAPRTNSTVANIYSVSDKDTLQLGVSPIYQSFNRSSNDLQIIQTNSGTNDIITLKNWYLNPVDMNVALSDGSYNLFELMNNKNYTMGVQYGTKSNAGICVGTSGNDSISVGASGIVNGGSGNDTFTFTGSPTNVTIYGGDGNDTVSGASKNIYFTVFGGDGADTIKTGNYADTVFTGSRPFRYNSNGSEFTVENALSTYQVDYIDLYSKYGAIDNFVEAGGGNDTIVSFGENASLNGGTGNDTYHVLDINNTVITDSSGTNTLTIHDWGNSGSTPKFVVMNVDDMGSFKINSENNFEIFILNEDSYRNWMVNSGENTTGFGGVRLTSNSAGNLINTVSTIDTEYMTLNTNNINTLKSDVASWLSANGFESVNDALKTENGYYSLEQIFTNFAATGWQMKS